MTDTVKTQSSDPVLEKLVQRIKKDLKEFDVFCSDFEANKFLMN